MQVLSWKKTNFSYVSIFLVKTIGIFYQRPFWVAKLSIPSFNAAGYSEIKSESYVSFQAFISAFSLMRNLLSLLFCLLS